MKGLDCEVCKKDIHVPKYEKDGLYVCASCGKVVGYLCSGCDRVYLENRLILDNGKYICKICGAPQWGYTQFKREHE